MTPATPWWRGAVIYQVYLRSFADGNGDGQGDLAGLVGKLDYIAGLGVDAIWLSPIHPSPNRDWGYDVSDYRGIHSDYGGMPDFKQLLSQAHARGVRVLTDEVLAHTSDEHAWFQDSLIGDSKADWYVWAPARMDGTAPNNWLSAFDGPAWSYHPARRRYCHHKFLRQQPKLNWRNPEARKAALEVLDHWLALGVDGFRLDVANAYLHDADLADNPPVPTEERSEGNWANAPNLQRHLNDSNLVENIEVLNQIRQVVEKYPDRFVMGEFSEEPVRSGCFAAPDLGLHSGYSFPLLTASDLGPQFIINHYAMLAQYPRHWPSVAFSNHDVMRTVSRFGGDETSSALARLMLALLLSLKGTAIIYQGEELGLPEASIERHQLKDPVGDLHYPFYKGRDGCRTPMPWNSSLPHLGFSTSIPWLPLSPAHGRLAVSEQEKDPQSALRFTQRFLAARRTDSALRIGEIEIQPSVAPVLAFVRKHEARQVLCVFNMSGEEAAFEISFPSNHDTLDIGSGRTHVSGRTLRLGPYAAWFVQA